MLMIPEKSQQRVQYEYHDVDLAGHPGAEETVRAIQEDFFWDGMRQHIKEYVRACILCNTCKPYRPTQPVIQRPRQHDLKCSYLRSIRGRRFFFVVTDLYSRWVEAFPIGNSTAPKLIKILEAEVFQRFGYPRALLSDNGPQE